jgi:3-hydroxyacyl-CoA dehydrogenase
MSDMAGGDIGWETRKRRAAEDPNFTFSKIPDLLCEQGRFGQKTGKGWYRYEAGNRTPLPDPDVAALIADYRRSIGLASREIGSDEIVQRCMYALVNEAAWILEEGIALRASDIDTVYVAGYGFPRHRGGPLFYADTVGLKNVLAAIEGFGKGYKGEIWKPAPLLVKLAKEGKTFN